MNLKKDFTSFVLAWASDGAKAWSEAWARDGVTMSVRVVHNGTLSDTYQVKTADQGTRYFEVRVKEIGA